jgi:hypothetical protein
MGDALELPAGILEDDALRALANGNPISSRNLIGGCPVSHGWLQLKNQAGELVALGMVEPAGLESLVHPKRVFLNDRS